MAYRGTQVTIPLGEVGLLTDMSPDKLPPGSLIYAKNIDFFKGVVEKAPGTLKYNASALASSVVAVHDWWPNTTAQRLIAVCANGSIHKGRDRAFTSMNTGLGTLTPNCMLVEGGQETASNSKKLFLFTNGVNTPYVLSGDGATFAAISNPSTDWTIARYPKCGVVHRSRLWAFQGQMAYASDTANHENFTSNYLVGSVYPGEGGEILGAFVYKTRLFVFKDGGFAYMLNDTDPDDANWFWGKISSSFGLSAPNAICEALDDMLAGNTTGTITSYAASQNLGDVDAADILQNAGIETFHHDNTSKAGLSEQHMLFYPEKKLMLATYRTSYQTTNDCLMAFNAARTQQPRISYWVKGTPNCLALYKDENKVQRPMYGDASGFVHLMDRETRLEGASSDGSTGTAYTGDFQVAHTNFAFAEPKLATIEKHFDWLAVHYLPESSGTLSCDYYIDGRFIETLSFVMVQNTDARLGVLTLGTDRFSQSNSETCIRKLAGSGRTFSARLYQAGSNQSFQITSITVGFRPGSERAMKVS